MNTLRKAQQATIVRPSSHLAQASDSALIKVGEIGDLDCVILHALEREPNCRYQSAADLAADVSRYMEHQTISAAPPSRWRRSQLFLRRHWALVSTVAAMTLVLAMGFAVSFWNYRMAKRSASEAVLAQQQAEQTIELLRDATFASNVRDHGAKQRLVQLGERVESLLAETDFASPKTQFELFILLGHAYSVTGRPDDAERVLTRAHDLSARDWAGPQERFLSSIKLAEHNNNQHQNRNAIALARQAIQFARTNENDRQRAQAEYVLATTLLADGQLNEAAEILRAVLDQEEPAAEVEPALALARAQVMYASVLVQQRNVEQAIANAKSGYQALKDLRGMAYANTLMAGHNLATILGATHRDAEAIPIFEEVLAARKTMLGHSHPDTLMTMTLLAMNLHDVGQDKRAISLFESALSVGDEKYQDRNPVGHLAAAGLAKMRLASGDLPAAIAMSQRTVQYAKAIYGAESWKVEIYRNRLAMTLLQSGQAEKALELATAAHRSIVAAVGENHRHAKQAAQIIAEANSEINAPDVPEPSE